MGRPTKATLAARIVVVAPPAGVAFGVQRGRHGISGVVTSTGVDLQFALTVLVDRGADGSPRLSGEFVQGPTGGKFVYVTVGKRAGQSESPWDRRAKVGLQTVTWAMVERVMGEPGSVLQARIAGTCRDGSPACATVPILDGGWTVERHSALSP